MQGPESQTTAAKEAEGDKRCSIRLIRTKDHAGGNRGSRGKRRSPTGGLCDRHEDGIG
jgi:hypothetical protein